MLSSDPLEFAHHYEDPFDQEAVALVAALLAYGNVKQIRRSLSLLLERMGQVAEHPSDFVRKFEEKKFVSEARRALGGFVHRFNQGEDVVLLFELLNRSWAKYGSLGGQFTSLLNPEAPHIGDALALLIRDWRAWAGPRGETSFSYLLTSPEDGSCCKRWCMFLRWMGRHDEVDLGLWTQSGQLAHTIQKGRWLKSSQLVIPLDTHTGRISQYLGLTPRKSMNWLAALDVTESLRAFDPQDPIRYDFAISRLGILDVCQREYRAEICVNCELLPSCHFAQNAARKKRRKSTKREARKSSR